MMPEPIADPAQPPPSCSPAGQASAASAATGRQTAAQGSPAIGSIRTAAPFGPAHHAVAAGQKATFPAAFKKAGAVSLTASDA